MIKRLLLLTVLSATCAFAAFETWTNKAGQSAKLSLTRTLDKDGEVAGEFKMENGKSVTLKASDLDEASGKRLAAENEKRLAKEKPAVAASIFDKLLDGNLVKLQGKSLKKCDDATKPTKYYLFYYTASWCPPCHAFTPTLVSFYDEMKAKHKTEFELVLITSDNDEAAMTEYAAEMKMAWPQLKLSKTSKFKSEVNHGIKGIPSLVLTDLEGKVLQGSYDNGTYLGPQVAMTKLEELLK